MRKIIFQMMISLDGYFEGPGREIDWHNVDDEFNEYAAELLNSVNTLLFGRVTYELMAGYWPSRDAVENDPVIAAKMNSLQKIVFSNTLKEVSWNNTRLVSGNITDEIIKLKQNYDKPVAILGSSDLAVELARNGLIDEFRIMINPVILGEGKPLLAGINARIRLKLTKTRVFKSGNVLLYYRPEYIKA